MRAVAVVDCGDVGDVWGQHSWVWWHSRYTQAGLGQCSRYSENPKSVDFNILGFFFLNDHFCYNYFKIEKTYTVQMGVAFQETTDTSEVKH